ncbi:MAG: type III pantothenate kinase [Deltaproteobacteria bacterium]|nr:type III pantothenate kinase [Deltaproteobacteria bacterium]
MLLVLDIGNTGILLGVFDLEGSGELLSNWRLSSSKKRTADEYGIALLGLLSSGKTCNNREGLDFRDKITGVAISCVVPELHRTLTLAITQSLGITPLVIGPGIKTGIPILTDDPREVGSDRIVNAVAAFNAHKCALIIVDMGTAITLDYITEKGEYAGGVIAPGILISAEALFGRAARLPRVEIESPPHVIGKNTADCMRSGLHYGFASLIDGMIKRIKKETNSSPKVVATGGQVGLIAAKETCKEIDVIDEFLVLKGLRIIYEANK